MERLLDAAGLGCDLVSSCPTCSYVLKVLLKEGACYSEEYQQRVGAGPDEIKVPEKGAGTDGYRYLKKSMYEKILKDFYDGKINILTGTQIISKGLDFPNVTLVGVINADIGLLNPDFRSTEKTFQILTQVSGRSGRSSKKGEVLIQTNHADYFVFKAVRTHDYQGFYEREVKMRRDLDYPPFSRIALIEVKSENINEASSTARDIFNFISTSDTKKYLKVFPPVQPLFSKLKDKHRFHIMIKSPKDKDPIGNYLASILRAARKHVSKSKSHGGFVTIDVDAVNLM
jgi:primosomal protein N' (replication factor Y)